MSKKMQKALIGLVLLGVLGLFQFFKDQPLTKSPTTHQQEILGDATTSARVTKIVDGDTIHVELNGKKETIRILGINTPETVDPRRKVECFGKEATQKAKSLLDGRTVVLEDDKSQGNRDRYARLLRYVFLPDGSDYGLEMVKRGYAYEYMYDKPYKYQDLYLEAQEVAEERNSGLWDENICN